MKGPNPLLSIVRSLFIGYWIVSINVSPCFRAASQPTDGFVAKVLEGYDPRPPEDFPYFVRIYTYSSNYVHCVGALVSSTKIITAAHCFNDVKHEKDGFNHFAVLGCNAQNATEFLSDNYQESCQIRYVDEMSLQFHDHFSREPLMNDIAILHINISVPLNTTGPNVLPLSLPNFNTEQFAASTTECFALGWGCIDEDGHHCGIQKVDLQLVDLDQCRQRYEENVTLTENSQLCTTLSYTKLCDGDSGGPLLCRGAKDAELELLGLLSFGDNNCSTSVPKVFTKLIPYKEWITGDEKADLISNDSSHPRKDCSVCKTFLIVGTIILILLCLIVIIFIFTKRHRPTWMKIPNFAET